MGKYIVNLDCVYFDDEFKQSLSEMGITFVVVGTYENCHWAECNVNFKGTKKSLKGLIMDFWGNPDFIQEIEKDKPVKFARKCSITGEGMNKGFVINHGELYIKNKSDVLLLAITNNIPLFIAELNNKN